MRRRGVLMVTWQRETSSQDFGFYERLLKGEAAVLVEGYR